MNMTKYEKLAQDLAVAVSAAKKAVVGMHDGGTCNFDCLVLRLPRWSEEKVLRAAKCAGTSASKWYHGDFHFFSPIWAQADVNTEQAETMEKIMASLGYDARIYYSMD